jgi:hypothetical protein
LVLLGFDLLGEVHPMLDDPVFRDAVAVDDLSGNGNDL